jgi:hypothetical protein
LEELRGRQPERRIPIPERIVFAETPMLNLCQRTLTLDKQ